MSTVDLRDKFVPRRHRMYPALDHFDFAMVVERRDGLHVARKVQVR
jgi:hypothetical protein